MLDNSEQPQSSFSILGTLFVLLWFLFTPFSNRTYIIGEVVFSVKTSFWIFKTFYMDGVKLPNYKEFIIKMKEKAEDLAKNQKREKRLETHEF